MKLNFPWTVGWPVETVAPAAVRNEGTAFAQQMATCLQGLDGHVEMQHLSPAQDIKTVSLFSNLG